MLGQDPSDRKQRLTSARCHQTHPVSKIRLHHQTRGLMCIEPPGISNLSSPILLRHMCVFYRFRVRHNLWHFITAPQKYVEHIIIRLRRNHHLTHGSCWNSHSKETVTNSKQSSSKCRDLLPNLSIPYWEFEYSNIHASAKESTTATANDLFGES